MSTEDIERLKSVYRMSLWGVLPAETGGLIFVIELFVAIQLGLAIVFGSGSAYPLNAIIPKTLESMYGQWLLFIPIAVVFLLVYCFFAYPINLFGVRTKAVELRRPTGEPDKSEVKISLCHFVLVQAPGGVQLKINVPDFKATADGRIVPSTVPLSVSKFRLGEGEELIKFDDGKTEAPGGWFTEKVVVIVGEKAKKRLTLVFQCRLAWPYVALCLHQWDRYPPVVEHALRYIAKTPSALTKPAVAKKMLDWAFLSEEALLAGYGPEGLDDANTYWGESDRPAVVLFGHYGLELTDCLLTVAPGFNAEEQRVRDAANEVGKKAKVFKKAVGDIDQTIKDADKQTVNAASKFVGDSFRKGGGDKKKDGKKDKKDQGRRKKPLTADDVSNLVTDGLADAGVGT